MREDSNGRLAFNWTALGVFVAAVVLIISVETAIYSSIVKENLAMLRTEVIQADNSLERRIVASETVHTQFDRDIKRIDDRLKDLEKQLNEMRQSESREERNGTPRAR